MGIDVPDAAQPHLDPADSRYCRQMQRRYQVHTSSGGRPSWTALDPALANASVCSSSKSPPRWVGDLWLRAFGLRIDFAKDIFARALKALVGSGISIPLYLILVGNERGFFSMLAEAELRLAALKASVVAGIVVFLLDLVLSLFRPPPGAWYGKKFAFAMPVQLLAVQVNSDDNERAFPFKIPMALPGAFAKIKVVVERRDDRVKAQINLAPSAPWNWENLPAVDREFGTKLSNLAPVYLVTNAAQEATSSTVRVFLLSLTYADKIDVRDV